MYNVEMTVLDWLKASTRYTFEEQTFVKIALDRGVNPYSAVTSGDITQKDKDLMIADIIFTAILLSPSSTSSLSQSHNGYQKAVGSETDYYQDDKITYAMRIYSRYGDPKLEELDSVANKRKIRFIPIVDVLKL